MGADSTTTVVVAGALAAVVTAVAVVDVAGTVSVTGSEPV